MDIQFDKRKWKEVRLSDVASEYSQRINNPSESEFDKFIGSSNIGQWDFRLKSWEPADSVTSAMKLFEKKDYLLVRRSLYASDFRERSPRAGFSGVCSGDILTIREKVEAIHDGFLVAILNSSSLWKFVVANASGSITRRIKWKDLSNYKFLLPPIEQQVNIASVLWSLDEIAKEKEKVLKSLYLLRAAVFSERTNYRCRRDYLQEGWVRKPIKEYAKVVRGSSPRPAGSPLYFDGNFLPWVTVGVLTNKDTPYINIDNIPSYLTEKGATQTRIIPKDTVLLSNSGYSLGVPAILPFEAGANDGVAAFLDLHGLSREYLYYFLDSKTKHFRESIAAGADQPNLNTTRIGNIEIPVPISSIQQEIVKEMSEIDEAIVNTKYALDNNKSLLLSILAKIDSGTQG